MQRVLHGPPRPPAAAARGAPSLEVAVAHGPVGLDGLLHRLEHLSVPAKPAGPASVATPIVEHRASPPRKVRGRHETRRVSPVLEQEPAPIDLPVEPGLVVRTETAPDRQVVRAVEDVDGVELDPANVL